MLRSARLLLFVSFVLAAPLVIPAEAHATVVAVNTFNASGTASGDVHLLQHVDHGSYAGSGQIGIGRYRFVSTYSPADARTPPTPEPPPSPAPTAPRSPARSPAPATASTARSTAAPRPARLRGHPHERNARLRGRDLRDLLPLGYRNDRLRDVHRRKLQRVGDRVGPLRHRLHDPGRPWPAARVRRRVLDRPRRGARRGRDGGHRRRPREVLDPQHERAGVERRRCHLLRRRERVARRPGPGDRGGSCVRLRLGLHGARARSSLSARRRSSAT